MTNSNQTVQKFLDKVHTKEIKIAVIGLGYVGLPLAVAFAESGLKIVGIDLDYSKVDQINRGHSYVEDIESSLVAQLVETGKLSATHRFKAIATVDAIIVCVPTPLTKGKTPDMSSIIGAMEQISQFLQPGQLVVLESTTYPGTTEELILPELSKDGYKVGEDFYLAFSPERIDPGRKDYTMGTTPKVLGGITPQCLEVAKALYSKVIEHVVPVSSTRAAEMVKLLENTYRAVNIGLINEIAIICDKLKLDVWEVIDAASTKPYGFTPFYPGPGLGGHCIPIDPQYLAWKLHTLNYHFRFIEVAEAINFSMPQYVVTKVTNVLNEVKKSVNGSKILILGVAYKANIGDLRESPALDVIELLVEKGAEISYNDPYVPHFKLVDQEFTSVSWENNLSDFDCVVIITNHSLYDWERIAQESAIVIDTRNALKGISTDRTRIIRL
jgi:UDP-N-acetyl-D-glucosamine dehydrogenase